MAKKPAANSGSLREVVEQLFGWSINTELERFDLPGWYYVGQPPPAECPTCGEGLYSFRCLHERESGKTTLYWALVCSSCADSFEPTDLGEAKRELYELSKQGQFRDPVTLDSPPVQPKKPAVKKPAVKKPAAKKPAAKKPGAKKPAVKKPAVKKPGAKKLAKPQEPSFVRVGRDIGRLISVADGSATVEFFDAPVPGGTHSVKVPMEEVRPVLLEKQTRVWWDTGECWRVGRVLLSPEEGSPLYLIALPNQEHEELPGEDLFVRWSQPLEDPLRLLISRTPDSPFFHKHRSRFLRAISDQHAAVEGLTGIGSAGIRLFSHQVTAARRVLLDPVQRYLLADEVGLGKTMEAGMVMRQRLLDQESAEVLVLVPDPLVAQWEGELDDKFRVFGLNGGEVRVKPHSWLSDDASDVGPLDLLVVDEAHRLTSSSTNAGIYEVLEGLAVAADAVLLLSATPVRSNEDSFLRLLHLLEPDLYRIEDLDAFRTRIEGRDAVADAVTMLSSDVALFLMDDSVRALRETFPEDPALGGLLDELEVAIGEENEVEGYELAVRTKAYVSETYRLHRRLIRTRRNEKLQDLFPVRGRERSSDWHLVDRGPERSEVAELLDRFRLELAATEDLPRTDVLQIVGSRCCAATPAIYGLQKALTNGDFEDIAEGDQEVVRLLSDHPLGIELGSWVAETVSPEEHTNRVELMSDWAWSHVGKRKVAACTSFTSVAEAAFERMKGKYGDHRVARLITGMSATELEQEADRSRTDPLCTLLVCDSVAEEGWNLQFVDEVLHLDVPWVANRLEQRLGRFDRLVLGDNRPLPVRSVVVVDDDALDGITGQWVRLLDEGFELFTRSSASLQYVLPEHETNALDRAIDVGFNAVSASLEHEREELEVTRRHIAGQDLLDAVDDTEDDDRYFKQLVAVDRRSESLGTAISGWLHKALCFTQSSGEPPWRFGVSTRSPPLLTESVVRGLGMYNFNLRYTPDRSDTDTTQDLSLLRPGEPLVDRFWALSKSDDRGVTYATFLGILPEGASPQTFFVFDVVVEADISGQPELSDARRKVFERQCERYLPRMIEKVWVRPGEGEFPQEGVKILQRELHKPKSKTRINLSTNPELFIKATEGVDWEVLCRQAESEAKAIVIERTAVVERLEHAADRVREDKNRIDTQLAARASALGEEAERDTVQSQFDGVLEAVSGYKVRIDNCGLTIAGPSSWLPET